MLAAALTLKKAVVLKSRPGRASQELQRLAELGRLSASLLHEISNPLTSALLHIEQYADKNSPAIKEARRSIRRIHRYVEAARQQARLESCQSRFAIAVQVSQVKRLALPIAKKANVRLTISTVPACSLYGDPVKFQQILANILINAIEAYERDLAPELDKFVKLDVLIEQGQLVIRVQDWGSGIAIKDIVRIFEPFFTTKALSGHGLGIGLALVKQYVTEDFKGRLNVQSTRRRGTVFTIRLPIN
jgi:two-component system NtrC family sensor kinase